VKKKITQVLFQIQEKNNKKKEMTMMH